MRVSVSALRGRKLITVMKAARWRPQELVSITHHKTQASDNGHQQVSPVSNEAVSARSYELLRSMRSLSPGSEPGQAKSSFERHHAWSNSRDTFSCRRHTSLSTAAPATHARGDSCISSHAAHKQHDCEPTKQLGRPALFQELIGGRRRT